MHASFFIQACGAGEAGGIDAQAGFEDAAAVTFTKDMMEQGDAQAAPAPGPAHAQRVYPAHIRDVGVFGETEGDAGNLIAIKGQKEEVRVVLRGVAHKVQPTGKVLRKGSLDVAPVVAKGFLPGTKDRLFLLVGPHAAHGDAAGQCGGGGALAISIFIS